MSVKKNDSSHDNYFNDDSNNNEEYDILFNLEVQIEDDKTANIIIRENDDIEDVVDKFCNENDYDDEVRKIIMNQIVQALDQNIEELEESQNNQEEEDDEENNIEESYEKGLNNNNNNINRENVGKTNNKHIDEKSKIKENPPRLNRDSNHEINEYVNYGTNDEYLEFTSFKNIPPISESQKNQKSKIQEDQTNYSSNVNHQNIVNNSRVTTSEIKSNTTPQSINSFSNFAYEKNQKGYKDYDKYESSKSNFNPEKSSRKSSRPLTPDIVSGNRLYNQYMDKLSKKEDQVKKIIEDRKRNEMKEAKFKPEINRKSQVLASHSPDLRHHDKVEDRLLKYGENKTEKLIKQITKKKITEYDHSYHPNVGQRSQIIATIKRRNRLDNVSKFVKTESDITEKNNQDNEVFNHNDSNEEIHSIKAGKINNANSVLKRVKSNQVDEKARKYSKISSDNTFTNMRQPEKEGSYERLKTFTSDTYNNISLKTERSISKSPCKNGKVLKTEASVDARYPYRKNSNKTYNPKAERSKTPVKMNPTTNIHDFLYIESKIKKENMEEKEKAFMKKNCPFKPTIPESSKKLISRVESQDQLIKRLHNTKKEAEELVVKKKKKYSLVDNTTGKPLFRPTVGRAPKDPKTREVTTQLDGYYDQKVISHKTKIHEEEILNNLEKKKLFLERSMKSILKMKIEKYKQIFDLLDSDRDGFISSRNIKLSSLDSDMLKTLTPLLEDLQKRKLIMNFKEFCLNVDKFLPSKIFSNVLQVSKGKKS